MLRTFLGNGSRIARWVLAIAALVAGMATSPAWAAPEEIEVYTNDINDPGQFAVELHSNYVATGASMPAYPGAESDTARLRLTPEWSYGVDDHFELGLYLPLATLDDHGDFRLDGYKFRLKWLGQHSERGFYYGINYEIGREDYHLDRNPWNNEIKLIGGWEGDHWLIGSNVNFDFALSGPDKTPPQVELDLKVGYKLREDTLVGFETYNGAGTTGDFGRFGTSEQSTFLTLDTKVGHWDLNFGVGKGYGSNPDGLILKMIIGLPLGNIKGGGGAGMR